MNQGLPPFPTGWYAICATADLAPGQVRKGTWMGQELVLWRTASGRPVLGDAHCPHLGAHLAHGGRVVGESLECPFHGFHFDATGRCVGTPYPGGEPPRGGLPTRTVVEAWGAVLTWFDAAGRPPLFDLPVRDDAGWTSMRLHTFPELRAHPQETSENGVDIGHFSRVHRYLDVVQLADAVVDGPLMRVNYGFRRRLVPRLDASPAFQVEFTASLHGLGFSLVETRVPGLGMQTRQLVLSTPTRPGHVELRIGVATRLDRRVPGLAPGMRRVVMDMFVGEVSADFEIWANKRYVEPPMLARGDGPVGRYRAWARQFYPSVGAAPQVL